jgi:5-methylcytosine-specific restriction endonuclease McrA
MLCADPVRYRQTIEDNRIRQAEQRKTHPENQARWAAKYNAAHREDNRRRLQDWQRRNPDRARWHAAKRRARMRGEFPSFETIDAVRIAARDRCAYCGSVGSLTIDHIVPVTRGGTNDMANLTFACKSCNSSKYNTLLSEWWEHIGRRRTHEKREEECCVAGHPVH